MGNFNSVCKVISSIGSCLLKGFFRMMFGALTTGLFALAIYGFIMITSESGWLAVSDFVAAIATSVVALSCMYAMGGPRKRGA